MGEKNNCYNDFVPLTYNGQGEKTDTTVKSRPTGLRAGGGRRKEKKRKEKATEGIRMDFDKSRQ